MDEAKTAAIQIVQNFRNHLDVIREQKGYSFEQASYQRWAVGEILNCLEKQEQMPPLIVIEKFRDEADKYSLLNKKANFIFSIAKDTADDIIDELIS